MVCTYLSSVSSCAFELKFSWLSVKSLPSISYSTSSSSSFKPTINSFILLSFSPKTKNTLSLFHSVFLCFTLFSSVFLCFPLFLSFFFCFTIDKNGGSYPLCVQSYNAIQEWQRRSHWFLALRVAFVFIREASRRLGSVSKLCFCSVFWLWLLCTFTIYQAFFFFFCNPIGSIFQCSISTF